MKNRFFKKTFIIFLFVSLLSWTFGIPPSIIFIPAAKAASTFNLDMMSLENEMMEGAFVGTSSDPVAVIRLVIQSDQGGVILGTTTLMFEGQSFATTSLADLSNATSSGVLLFNDSGSQFGAFDDDDMVVTMNTAPSWIGTTSMLELKNFNLPPSINNGSKTYFYLAIRTSATASHGTTIIASVFQNNIETSDSIGPGENFQANPCTVDLLDPSVISVDKINSNKVEIQFSEMIDFMSGPPMASDFSLSDGITVQEAFMEGPGVIRIVADSEIYIGSTTLTINTAFTDFAGNALSDFGPHSITEPKRIKISEVSAEMGSADSEFIELYNASEAITSINNWLIQYSPYNDGSTWTTIATTTGSIPGYSFFLISTPQYDSEEEPDGDINYSTATLNPSGGHIRLSDGTSTIDLLGWGAALSPENIAATTHSSGGSIERKAMGMSTADHMTIGGMDENMGNSWDTNNNQFDFVVQTDANPQNLSSPTESFIGAESGAMINHMPLNVISSSSALTLNIQMGDPMTPIEDLTTEVHFMAGDGSPQDNVSSDYSTAVGTHIANGYFQFTVPQNVISASVENGLYYYIKLITSNGSQMMSASPQADMSNDESLVAQNPFIVEVRQSGTLYNINGTAQLNGTSTHSGILVILEGAGISTSTDASGNYSLQAENGVYNIILIKTGYYEEWINDIFVNNADITAPTRTMNEGTGGGITGDTEKPMINWTGPQDGMFGVPAAEQDFLCFAGFSKEINASTFSTSSVILSTDGSTPVAGYSMSYNPVRTQDMPGENTDPYLGVVYPPAGGFLENTTYYIIYDGSIRDTSGNSLQGNRPEGGHVVSFTTGTDYSGVSDWSDFGTGEMMPPFVVDEKPIMGANNVAPNTKVIFTFSEIMDESSVISTGSIKLYEISIVDNTEQLSAVTITTTMDSTKKIAIVTPSGNLSAGKYKAVVTGALKSAEGIWLGDPVQGQNTNTYDFYVTKFEVDANAVLDISAPTILGSWPSDTETNIPVNPGALNIQFSEGLDPSTVDTNIIQLKRGSSIVNSNVFYDSKNYSVELVPQSVLATEIAYAIYITGGTSGITDIAGNPLAATTTTISFTTDSNGDTLNPEIMYANGDDFGIALTFNEPMKTATVADTSNWPNSVLNPNNYILKYGPPATAWASGGTIINLNNVDGSGKKAKFNFDSIYNTVMIEDLGLDPATLFSGGAVDFYIDMSTSSAADLSGNLVASSSNNTFQLPINSSADTLGFLGPGDEINPDMEDMGMMRAGVFPMNGMANQTTTYFVDIPTTKAIPSGGKITITFPTGFGVSSAEKDQYSPVNNDINEWNAGVVTIASVNGEQATGMITIITGGSDTQTNDFLHMDISNIINSSIPRGFETEGYNVDVKTYNDSGDLLETVATMPFFINQGGSASLIVSVVGIEAADVDGTADLVDVYLDSPFTGPMDMVISIANDGTGSSTFANLPEGSYMLFTEPMTTLDGNDYSGNPMPEPIYIGSGLNNKNISLSKESAGAGKATITINLTGSFGTDDVDFFAGSPSDFKVKTILSAGDDPSAQLFLPDGNWMIGIGPAMPKGPMTGPPPMPDWMPPANIFVTVSNSGTEIFETSGTANDGILALAINQANKQIIGYVKDGEGNPIADAEVFAHQPMGDNMGSYTKTDTAGKFVLKIANNGNYKLGTFKPGLPYIPEKSAVLKDDTGNVATDGNSSADVYNDSATLVTLASPFEFIVSKPGNTISGKVTDGTNPVSFAPVWTDRTDASGHADTMTDSSGNFILYVNNGTWMLNAYIPNFGDAESKTVIVDNTNETQNLSPNTSFTYYSIVGSVGKDTDGTFSTLEDPFEFMPIRAVEYNAQGIYQGKEYGSMTDSQGNYSISVPAGIYRVDIWTPDFGELGINNLNDNNTLNELADDAYANNQANVDASGGNVINADIVIAQSSLRTITLAFSNAAQNQEGFLHVEGLDFPNGPTNSPEPNGFHNMIRFDDLSATNTLNLSDGDYAFFLDVPGLGSYIPDASSRDGTKDCIVVSADKQVDFTLLDLQIDAIDLSGTIYAETATSGSELADAWVWVGNPLTGYHNGTMSASDGSYSLQIPIANGYKIGSDKPGYISEEPTDFNAATNTIQNFTLSSYSLTISGRLYDDLNTNSQYDSGEEITNGFLRAETVGCADGNEQTDCKRSHSPADGSGMYSLGIQNGEWKIYGMSDGYSETYHGSIITVSGSNQTANIKLTTDSNWSQKSKKKPITPSSGGTLDDTTPEGTGVKLTIPPNALGNSSASGNINANNTSAVTETNSFDPIGGQGINVTAADNSGQSISSLSDYIDIEVVKYKAEIDAEISTENLTYAKLKNSKNGYWDSTVNDWVNLATTRTAYYKTNSANTEWTLYSNAASSTPAFEAFITELAAGSISPADYKLVFKSKTNHLTIFAVIMPFIVTVAQAEPEPEPEPDPPASGGGGGSYTSLCSTVTYGAWGECLSNIRSRIVLTKSPSSCRLSTAQETDKTKICSVDDEEKTPTTQILKEIDMLYLDQGAFIARGEINEILNVMKKERDGEAEIKAREILRDKMKIDLSTISTSSEYALTNFIAYGSPDTKKLGSGERAGVMNSFKAAFGKLPTSNNDWSNVIKIANGRWPDTISSSSEAQATDIFIKIYKKIPDRLDPFDDAAITVIAYGLRPANRNTESEKAAIKIFKAIFDYHPNSATDWDVVRAIAYSGATRSPDADGDLLIDTREETLGTDPNIFDTDGDGFGDGAEVKNGYDPLN